MHLSCCVESLVPMVSFKPDRLMRSILCHPKDTVAVGQQNGVVYEIECECGAIYIGETGRYLETRKKRARS